MGDRLLTLEAAIEQLGKDPNIVILGLSQVYETKPIGLKKEAHPAQAFLNMVIQVNTVYCVEQMLSTCLQVEEEHGRVRLSSAVPQPQSLRPATKEGYSSRTLDIDILLFGTQVYNQKKLNVPHPRMHKRAFVLLPLCELIPQMIHPVLHLTMRECLNALPLAEIEDCKAYGHIIKVRTAEQQLC